MYGWGWNGGGWDWANWLGMALVMLAFWVVLAGGVVLLVRYLRPHPGSAPSGPPAPPGAEPSRALQILDERFARGEIAPEEYASRREKLRER